MSPALVKGGRDKPGHPSSHYPSFASVEIHGTGMQVQVKFLRLTLPLGASRRSTLSSPWLRRIPGACIGFRGVDMHTLHTCATPCTHYLSKSYRSSEKKKVLQLSPSPILRPNIGVTGRLPAPPGLILRSAAFCAIHGGICKYPNKAGPTSWRVSQMALAFRFVRRRPVHLKSAEIPSNPSCQRPGCVVEAANGFPAGA